MRKQNESSNFLKQHLYYLIQTHKNGNEAFKQSWHEGILYTIIFSYILQKTLSYLLPRRRKED